MKLSVSSLTSWPSGAAAVRPPVTSASRYTPQLIDLDDDDAPTMVAPPRRSARVRRATSDAPAT